MNERTYHDWLITKPTTRRLNCGGLFWPGAFDETDGEGLRLFLTGDSDGEDNLYVVPSGEEDFDRACRVIMQHALPWPATRFGTWRRYRAIVTWARAVFEFLGYEPTDDEAALFAALEEYAQKAPARYAASLTILSVREAVAYMDKHYNDGMPGHLTSERHTSRLLSTGVWPCARTAAGRLGITVGDLRAIWETPWTPPAKAPSALKRLLAGSAKG